MSSRLKKVLSAVGRLILGVFVLFVAYLLVIAGLVIWTFEVKLKRWPMFVHSAPLTLKVGDHVETTGFMKRLSRLGYEQTSDVIPLPGQWHQSGAQLRIYLLTCPIQGRGIAGGPVQLSLDSKKVASIRLLLSSEEVGQVMLGPELLDVIPARGGQRELCRAVYLARMNPLLIKAVVITEDARFYSHSGIDLVSMRHAVTANIRARRYIHGASTITQQLVRMAALSHEKTLWRKFNEVFLALVADAIYDKNTILQAYLNRVYLGQWNGLPIKGMGEAARLYFGKDQSDLTPAECALLAAMIRAPNVINPYRHPDRARGRRNMVLGLLLKEGAISQTEHDLAVASPVTMRKPGAPPVRAGAFLDLVHDALNKLSGATPGVEGRQDVLTSLDPLLQHKVGGELAREESAGQLCHVIHADPETGFITAFVGPTRKWSGSGGDPETLLPLLLIPALLPDKYGNAGLTPTSRVFPVGSSGASVMLRDALSKHGGLLLGKLLAVAGPERMREALKQFGVQAHADKTGILRVEPMTPLEIAQVYAIMAVMGNAGTLGPAIKIGGFTGEVPQAPRRKVQIDPRVLFVINQLMKDPESIAVREGRPDASGAVPSRLTARDEWGMWSIAYGPSSLLLLRLQGQSDETALKALTDRILQVTRFGEGRPGVPPDGLVFRKICVDSGLRATSLCPKVIREPFLPGTQPSEWCPLRHEHR